MYERKGIFQDHPETMQESIDLTSAEYQAEKARLNELIKKKKGALHAAWRQELLHIIQGDTQSPLGMAFANYEASFNLLIAFIEMAMPMEEQHNIMRQLIAILSKDAAVETFAGSKTAIASLLKQSLSSPFMAYLPTQAQLNDLKFFLDAQLEICSKRSDYYFLDEAEASILKVIDDHIREVKKERSTYVKVTQKEMKTFINILDSWRSINPNDVNAVQDMQNQMGAMLAMMHASITNGDNRGPNHLLASASQGGLFGRAQQDSTTENNATTAPGQRL